MWVSIFSFGFHFFSDIKNKSGECPEILEESESESKSCLSDCDHDSDCSGALKCCPSSCGGAVCVQPLLPGGNFSSLSLVYVCIDLYMWSLILSIRSVSISPEYGLKLCINRTTTANFLFVCLFTTISQE